jgi:hypothetical protein
MSPQGNQPGGPSDTRPYLCVPYWIAPLIPGGKWDDGELRPLSADPGVISYACNAIHTGPYTPGQPLNVTVDVLNSGGSNSPAIVTVAVYWADPTVGFAKPNFFAASTVVAPSSRTGPSTVTTPVMTATIPASAPDHVCLVVSVSHPQDRAGTVCDPMNDRHWAQHNLQAVKASTSGPTILPITVANPFPSGGMFDLVLEPADARRAQLLAAKFRAEVSGVGVELLLLNAQGAPVSQAGQQTHAPVQLGPLAQQQFRIAVELDGRLLPNQIAAVEARLLASGQDGRAVGSLGTVLLGS